MMFMNQKRHQADLQVQAWKVLKSSSTPRICKETDEKYLLEVKPRIPFTHTVRRLVLWYTFFAKHHVLNSLILTCNKVECVLTNIKLQLWKATDIKTKKRN